jgi:dihydrofolate synthase/folylpolyglutamate synthase
MPPDAPRQDLQRYEAAAAWLESFIKPITGLAPQRTPASWSDDGPRRLARLDGVLDSLGHPERGYRTLHVTGTSGKGSVCTYLGAVLREAGLRTGVHTTPYLQVPVEKLEVDGRYVAPEEFASLVEDFRSALPQFETDRDALAYPGMSVVLTYLHFARRRVDLAVVETSAGGRYDWTNTLSSAVSVITTVGPDHLGTLGPGLADVAFHKAGIIKPGCPSVTGVRPPYLSVVEAEAERQGTSLRRLGHEFDYRVRRCSDAGTVFDFISGAGERRGLETRLIGRHQAFNAALAVAAIDAFGLEAGPVDDAALRRGLYAATFPGRMELIQHDPDVLLDGAHNPEKAAALAVSLAEIFPDRRLLLVVGALSTKDVGGILAPFREQTRRAFVTVPHVLGKAGLDPERLARSIHDLGIQAHPVAGPAEALSQALAEATPDDLVCVTGSLYLVGELRRLWVPDEQVLLDGNSAPAPGTSVRVTSGAASA